MTYQFNTTAGASNAKATALSPSKPARGVFRPMPSSSRWEAIRPLILRQVGVRVPIYPVKGISLTCPAAPWPGAPEMPVIDDSGLFGLVPIGDRLRVSGSAEIAGYDATPSPVRGQAIVDNVLKTFP